MKRYNFPFDYKPKLDLKNTMIYSSTFKQLIFKYFQDKYHAIYVDPSILVTNKLSSRSHVNGDRMVNFDNKVSNIVVGLNNNQENYLTLLSSLLKSQNIISYNPFIRRDAEQTNTNSVFNWNINLDLAMPKDSLTIEYFVQYIKTFFNEIIEIANNPILKKIFTPLRAKTKPKKYAIIYLNKLEKDYPTSNLNVAMTHFLAKNKFAIIVNNFQKTKSNNWLETPVVTAVDLDCTCGLYVYDEVNDKAINIINIVKRPDGNKSMTQLKEINPIELTNDLYSKSLFDKDRPTNMGVSINYTNLLFYLLDKIHLAEVVSSIWPDDFIDFAKKSKIEIF